MTQSPAPQAATYAEVLRTTGAPAWTDGVQRIPRHTEYNDIFGIIRKLREMPFTLP